MYACTTAHDDPYSINTKSNYLKHFYIITISTSPVWRKPRPTILRKSNKNMTSSGGGVV